MVRFSRSQRKFIAEKLMDSANYALAGLVFGQLVTDRVRLLLLILGVAIYLLGWATAIRLRKGVE
jgi:hypothetical protein